MAVNAPKLGKLGTIMVVASLLIIALGLGLKAKRARGNEDALEGVDPACYKAIISDSAALKQADGTYLFRRADYVYGPIAYDLINRKQYSVIAAQKVDDWCLAALAVDGTVEGNSYRGDVLVYGFLPGVKVAPPSREEDKAESAARDAIHARYSQLKADIKRTLQNQADSGPTLYLNQADAASLSTENSDVARLDIGETGSLHWNGEPVDELGMRAQFVLMTQSASQRGVIIQADSRVGYEVVAQVLADAEHYGVTKVAFAEAHADGVGGQQEAASPVAPQVDQPAPDVQNDAESAGAASEGGEGVIDASDGIEPTADDAGATTGAAEPSNTLPEALLHLEARYPPQAIRLRHEGTTILMVRVSPEGESIDAKVEASSGHLELDKAALDAARRERFKPATRDGRPVEGYARLPYSFALKQL